MNEEPGSLFDPYPEDSPEGPEPGVVDPEWFVLQEKRSHREKIYTEQVVFWDVWSAYC